MSLHLYPFKIYSSTVFIDMIWSSTFVLGHSAIADVGPMWHLHFLLHCFFKIPLEGFFFFFSPCLSYLSYTMFQVDMVIIPATTGQMGVLPGHVPTIAELKPGILSVHEGNDVTKYFLSSGFAFIHANSVADVIAVEAVPVDHIDPSLVQKGLTDFTQKLSSATTELDKTEAQIGVDIHSALNAALSG